MMSHMSDRKAAAHLPADLLSLILGAAFLIIYAVLPLRYSWLGFLLFGLMGFWLGISILRQRPTSPAAWFNVVMGVAGVAVGVYFFFALRTI
jgi:hypothetical protein